MRRAALLLLILGLPASAMERAWGWCQQGGARVVTAGINSTNFYQQSFPSCTVTVYLSGTLTVATIFSDNASTVKGNPFTSAVSGAWFFYAANGRYDISLTGGGITGTVTYSDVLLNDGGGGGGGGGGITSLNGLTGAAQTFGVGTTGADFNIVSSGSSHVFNIPTANGTNRGLLNGADWTRFNACSSPFAVTAPITLSAGVIGLTTPLPIAFGGSGQATSTAAFNALSVLTTKGDLLGFGSANARIPIGTNNQALVADSTQSLGLKWLTSAFLTLTSPLNVANGGLGLTSGTSGGIPAYTGTTTVTSSGLLVLGNPVFGGGAGAAPSTTGAATAYNGQTLAGNGLVTTVLSSVVQTNQTSTHSAQVLLTAPTAGVYRVAYYLTTGSVSDGTATAQVAFGWTDGVGAKANTPLAALALAAAANQSSTYLVSIASGNLTYTVTYSAGAGGNYNLLITVERL